MSKMKLALNYAKLHEWEAYQAQLAIEYQQCFEEGLDITPYEVLFKAVAELDRGEMKEKLSDVCFQIVQSLPIRKLIKDADSHRQSQQLVL